MTAEQSEKKPDEKKVGVYICHCGGNISDHVDVAQLAKNVAGLDGVAVTHTNMFMCSDPGQELIQEDLKSGKINRVVVASCAPSLHELTFRSAIKRADKNPYQYKMKYLGRTLNVGFFSRKRPINYDSSFSVNG